MANLIQTGYVVIYFLKSFCFLCFGFLASRHLGSQLLDQGLNPHPLHWKVRF